MTLQQNKIKKLNVPSISFRNDEATVFISSQAMIFFTNIYAFIKPDSYYRAAEIFENRDNVEFLLKEVENKLNLDKKYTVYAVGILFIVAFKSDYPCSLIQLIFSEEKSAMFVLTLSVIFIMLYEIK